MGRVEDERMHRLHRNWVHRIVHYSKYANEYSTAYDIAVFSDSISVLVHVLSRLKLYVIGGSGDAVNIQQSYENYCDDQYCRMKWRFGLVSSLYFDFLEGSRSNETYRFSYLAVEFMGLQRVLSPAVGSKGSELIRSAGVEKWSMEHFKEFKEADLAILTRSDTCLLDVQRYSHLRRGEIGLVN